MARFKGFLGLFCVLALAALACSVSVDLGTQPSGNAQSQQGVATGVAQTLQAFTLEALSVAPTSTPSPTSTATSTPIPQPATLSVSVATNCYAGPGTNYGFVITIRPGTTATVEGKDTADNYWIIDAPGYPGTLCWLSGQYASVSGDTAHVPAPATPAIPNYTLSEPKNLRVSCTSQADSDADESWWRNESDWTVVFRWTNTEPDQSGVRVYRNGRQLASLGAHASAYTDTFFHHRRGDVTYGVQAFNRTQVSSIVSVDVRRCK